MYTNIASRLNPTHFPDQRIKLRAGSLSPRRPSKAIANSVDLIDQHPQDHVHRVAPLKKAEDGGGRNGGHQAARAFIAPKGGVSDGRAVHILAGRPEGLRSTPWTVVDGRTKLT